jgi:hypothetical protein
LQWTGPTIATRAPRSRTTAAASIAGDDFKENESVTRSRTAPTRRPPIWAAGDELKRSTRLYKLAMSYNRGLDRDKDGIACETASAFQ